MEGKFEIGGGKSDYQEARDKIQRAVMARDLYGDEGLFDPHSGAAVDEEVVVEGQGYYQLMTDCGYRAPDGDWQRCLAFNDPDRPQICHEFPADSPGCHRVRMTRGLAYDEKVLFSTQPVVE